MKQQYRYYLLYLLLWSSTMATAQSSLWNTFNQVTINHNGGTRDINVMYYDSVTDKSYIAGNFYMVDGDTANVISFDGTNFQVLPNAPTGYIQDIVRYHDKLYVGGAYGLAIWNGSSWSGYSNNNNWGIRNICIINDKLYVTGSFTAMGGQPIAGVAIYNDTIWSAFPGLDTVWPGGAAIADIEYYKGEFYLASQFQKPERPQRTGLIRFDGQQWYNVADFVTDGMGFVKELMVWNDTLYVAGYFDEVSGGKGNGIAKWDGQQWHRLQRGVQVHYERGAVTEMAVHNNKLYISGTYTTLNGWYKNMNGRFACWDGNQWCDMGSSFQPGENVFGSWRNRFFVAGGFEAVAGMPTKSVAEWIGGNYADTCISNPLSLNSPVAEQDVYLYPNPVQGSTTLRLNSRKNAPVAVNIYDSQGRLCQNIITTLRTGNNSFTLDCTKFTTGIYVIMVTGEHYNLIQQMIKL